VQDDDDRDVSREDADRIVRGWPSATLMTTGEYQDPRGAWTPSVLY